jgi:hypothetical protein
MINPNLKDNNNIEDNNNQNDNIPENLEDNNIQEPLGEVISILNYFQNPKINKLIDSPKTLKAMKDLGYAMEDIYYLTFNEFLDQFQEFRRFSLDIQQYLYDSYENHRLEKIQTIKDKRDYNIKNNININENHNLPYNKQLIAFSSSIKEAQKKFEQIQRKNKLELINAIKAQLENQIIIKKGESKMRKDSMKKDKFQKQLEIKNYNAKKELENREYRKNIQEKEREKQLVEENKKKYEIAQQFEKKKAEKEKEKLKEKEKKKKEIEEKRIKFEKKVEKMNNDFNNKIIQKMLYMEEREKERLIQNEEKKKRIIDEHNEKMRIKQLKIYNNKINYNKKLEEQKQKYKFKELREKNRKRE